jgi:Cytochrome P460
MRLVAFATALLLAGCRQGATPEPALVEPAEFSTWPAVTEAPVPVGLEAWIWCRTPTPEEERRRTEQSMTHGPHAGYAIVVRVSPGALEAFRNNEPLPAGAVVIKEKYADASAMGPMQGYALMRKRESGYDSDGGDWEYAFVGPAPAKNVIYGRLAQCAGCHASAKDRDFLFRSYGDPKR